MVTTKPTNQPPSDPQPQSLSKFLYKVLAVLIVIFVLPLFPSRAPDFINQNLFTRGWELVHLLFVGIAVCYGLFSRRNQEEEYQKGETLDGFETFVSRFLQASSSVFDDHRLKTLEGDNRNSSTSVQSWSSQYSRNAPVVVVAADDYIGGCGGDSNGDGESRGMVSRSVRTRILGVNYKPLLLPVRSLKGARAFESGQVDGSNLKSFRRSNSSRGVDEQEDNNVVLRSPIPWRSRSGRMEMKEGDAESFDLSDEYVVKPVVRSDQQIGIKSDPSTPSTPKTSLIDLANTPRTLSGYTHLVSPELVAKETEDSLRQKTIYKSTPPPAPPLPPPKYHKPESPMLYSSSGSRMQMVSVKKGRGISSGEDSGRSVREEMMRRMNSRNTGSNLDNTLTVGKSVRTSRSSESLSVQKAPKEAGTKGYWKDVMEAPKEPARSERKLLENDQHSFSNEKSDQEMNIPQVTLGKEEKVVPEDIVTAESDSDSDSDDEHYDQVSETLSSFTKGEPEPVIQVMPSLDVDKKADEFIAKFREQIRLQRIESIKRSTYEAARKVT